MVAEQGKDVESGGGFANICVDYRRSYCSVRLKLLIEKKKGGVRIEDDPSASEWGSRVFLTI